MKDDNINKNSDAVEQLKKYADDFAQIYKSEKGKRKELEAAHKQLVKYADALNSTIVELKKSNKELQNAYLDTINRLVLASEYKDEDTGAHITRISRYSSLLAEKLGLSEKDAQDIEYAAPMHDVGKIGIADGILLKTTKLTEEEFKVMKNHTLIGSDILSNSSAEILIIAERIAVSHHEKWNGTGYPHGLEKDNIPLPGRIVAIVDTFDALTSRRPYKDPYPFEIASDILRKNSGLFFDPEIVNIFLSNIDKIMEIKNDVESVGDLSVSGFTWSDRDVADGINTAL